jgi:hypothetical protein
MLNLERRKYLLTYFGNSFPNVSDNFYVGNESHLSYLFFSGILVDGKRAQEFC